MQVRTSRSGVRLLCLGRPDGPALVCFPCAGGSASSFRALAAAMPSTWRLIAIDPPGHGLGGGRCLDRIEHMVDAYLEALEPHLDGPYHLLGHSMGGLIAYLTALRLQRSARPPRGVFILAVRGPERVLDEAWSTLSDRSLAARLDRVGGVPPLFRDRIDELRGYLPAIRADFRALERFSLPAPDPLEVPAVVVAARDDRFVPPERVREWLALAPGGRYVELPAGGHFLHQSCAPALAGLVQAAAAEDDEPRDAALDRLRREVDVWLVRPERACAPAQLDAWRALLSADELARHRRYVFENSRRQFLIGHALLRAALSRYVDRDPRDWRFAPGPHGRPDLLSEPGLPPLRFNISHTEGLVAVAIGIDRELGVDVEDLRRETRAPEFAAEFLAPREQAELSAAPPAARTARFFELWTLKEAYLKARGLGLSLPLDSLWFGRDGGRIAATFLPSVGDDPARWQFEQMRPTDRHLLSLAVERRAGPDLAVRLRRALPFADLLPDVSDHGDLRRQDPTQARRGP